MEYATPSTRRVSTRTARPRCLAGHAAAGLQPQVPAALSRSLARLPRLRSLLPNSRGSSRIPWSSGSSPAAAFPLRQMSPPGSLGRTLDPSRHANPGRVQPARLLSTRCRTAPSVSLGSVPGPAGHVWGVLQESPPLHSGHHALPDAHLTRFLHFLESHQISKPSAIPATHISDFLRSQIHLRPKTLAVVVSDLRSFLPSSACKEASRRISASMSPGSGWPRMDGSLPSGLTPMSRPCSRP